MLQKLCHQHPINLLSIFIQNVSEERKRSFFGSSEANGSHLFRNGSNTDTRIDVKEETTYTASQEDLKRLHKDSIMNRMPANSEATTVLVLEKNLLKCVKNDENFFNF